MAIIGSIRKRSTLLLIVIGGALVLFVLSDFLSNQGGGRRGRKIEPLAEIFGEDIGFREFDNEVQTRIEMQKESNPEYSPSGMELFQMRQQMFDQKIKEKIYLNYCVDLGLALDQEYSQTPAINVAEFRDMLMGNDPHPSILREFTNKQTGQFDPNQVKYVLENQDQLDNIQRLQWHFFLEDLKRERLSTKYKNLIAKTFYLPSPLAKAAHHESRDQATLRFVAKRYDVIHDTMVTVTDEDFRKYYEENKKQYDREAQATLNFVIFEARPSPKDISVIENRFNNLFEKLQQSEEPDVFVNSNSHDRYDSTWFKKGQLPIMIDSILFNAPIGTSYGPFIDGKKYKGAVVVDTKDRPDSLRASHILIAFKGAERANENVTRTRNEAELYADSILTEVKKNPGMFEMLASTISDDAFAREKMGDLNWFNEQMMAPEFSVACLNNNVGEYVLTETIFGYHIVKVTGKKDFSRQVRVAILTQDIEPSKETISSEFTRASRFSNKVESLESFENLLEKEGIAGSEAVLSKDMYSVQTIQDAREIVRWAFNEETEPGKTTRMFEFPDKYQYVIGIVKSRRDKGIWELDEELKNILEPLVRRDKKFEMIAKEMKNAGGKDLYKIANTMGLQVDTANISFNMNNLMNWGPEVRVIGTAFSQPKGKITEPIKGVISGFVLVVDERIKAGEPENLVDIRMFEERTYNQIVQQYFDQALQKAADFKDNRILWF